MHMTRKAIMTNTLVLIGILAAFHVSSHVTPNPLNPAGQRLMCTNAMLITGRLQNQPDLSKTNCSHSIFEPLQSSKQNAIRTAHQKFCYSTRSTTALADIDYLIPEMLSSILLNQGKNILMSPGLAKEPRAPNLWNFTCQISTNSIVKERKVCFS